MEGEKLINFNWNLEEEKKSSFTIHQFKIYSPVDPVITYREQSAKMATLN